MLRTAFFIARKDVAYMLREKETILWTFVMPVLFFWFIGTVTGGFAGGGDGKDALVLHVPADAGFLSQAVVAGLQAQDYEVIVTTDAEQVAEYAGYRRHLDLPAGFTEAVAAGEPVTLPFVRTGEGLAADYDELRASLAVYRVLADLILADHMGLGVTPQTLQTLAGLPRALTLEVRPAGRRKEIPSGFEQAVPGTMVMFTMMLLLTSGAILLMIERTSGLLRRLASAPVSRGSVVLGKWGGKMALAMVQIGYAMAAGTLLFDVDWGSGAALAMVLAVLFGWAALCASLGILLGTSANTEGQAMAVAVVGTMALAALGGCWWPIEVTPPWMQSLALFLPTGWTMDAMHRLLSFRDLPSTVWPHVLGLLALALLTGAWASRRFRFE